MKTNFAIKLVLLQLIIALSACSSGFQVNVSKDEMNPDIFYISSTYIELKKGYPTDEGTLKLKLQNIYNKEDKSRRYRVQFLYQGNTWTNINMVQFSAGFSTYNLTPEIAPDKKRAEAHTVEESFWVDVEEMIFKKIMNSQRWKIILHSEKRRFELELDEDDIAEMTRWYEEAKDVRKKNK